MKKLTRTEANFENLLEAAILLEGHCRHAEHGCSCRGCDECEENYMAGQEEGESELTLDELIDRELGPNTDIPYGDDPRADSEEYDEDAEEMDQISGIGDVINAVVSLPTDKELKQKRGGILGIGSDPVIQKVRDVRRQAGTRLDKILKRLDNNSGVY